MFGKRDTFTSPSLDAGRSGVLAGNVTRSVVWGLFLVALVAGLLSVGAAQPDAVTDGFTFAQDCGSETGPRSDCDPQGGVGTTGATLSTPGPDRSSAPILCDNNANADSCLSRYEQEPTALLPAWRWRSDVGLYNNSGNSTAGILQGVASFLASFLFAIAGLLWWILLAVSRWVFTADVLERGWQSINGGFAALSNMIFGSGLVVIAIFAGLLVVLRAVLKVQPTKAIAAFLTVVIPLATIQVLATNIDDGNGDAPPRGSPAWIAMQGSSMVDSTVGNIGTGFGLMSTTGGSALVQNASAGDPSCASYVLALYDQYFAYASSVTEEARREADRTYNETSESFSQVWGDSFFINENAIQHLVASEASTLVLPQTDAEWDAALANRSFAERQFDAANVPVATVSMLWQRSFLSSWTTAQFGDNVAGQSAYCHVLDNNAGISTDERYSISQVANNYSNGAGYQNITPAVFTPWSGDKEGETRVFAWMACDHVRPGVWQADPGWAALGDGKNMTDDVCTAYFNFDVNLYRELAGAQNDRAGWLGGLANFSFGIGEKVTNPVGSFLGYNPQDLILGSTLEFAGVCSDDDVSECFGDGVEGLAESNDIDGDGNIKKLNFNTSGDLDDAVNEGFAGTNGGTGFCSATSTVQNADDLTSGIAGCEFSSLEDVRQAVKAYWGHNTTQRVSFATLTLITAIIYVYALGAVAIGAMLAKFGLVLMLALLPITLLMLAMPSAGRGAGNANRPGIKMLRLTGGFFLANLVLGVVMLLLLQTILLFESLVNGDGGSIMSALIPLVSLMIIKRLLEYAGLGSITSLGGAVGMSVATAAAATGDNNLQNQARGMFSPNGSRAGAALNSGDRLAKKMARRSAVAPLRAADWQAKKLDQQADNKDHYLARRAQRKQLQSARKALGPGGGTVANRARNLSGVLGRARAGQDADSPLRAAGTKFGKKFTSFGRSNKYGQSTSKKDMTQTRMEQRRKLAESLKGKDIKDRKQARRDYARHNHEGALNEQRAVRDSDGSVVRTADGKPIFGWETREADGSTSIVGFDEYNSLSEESRSAYTPITSVDQTLTATDLETGWEAFEGGHDLRPGQAVHSRIGLNSVPAPVASTNGKLGLVQAKSTESSVELARQWRVQYLPNEQKMRPKGMSDDQYNLYLTQLERDLGGFDEHGLKTDALIEFGIDADRPEGREEILLALEGESSLVADRVAYEVSEEQQRAAIAYALAATPTRSARDVAAGEVSVLVAEHLEAVVDTQAAASVVVSAKATVHHTAQRLQVARAAEAQLEIAVEQRDAVQAKLEDLIERQNEHGAQMAQSTGVPAHVMQQLEDTAAEISSQVAKLEADYDIAAQRIVDVQTVASEASQISDELNELLGEVEANAFDATEASRTMLSTAKGLEAASELAQTESHAAVLDALDEWDKAHAQTAQATMQQTEELLAAVTDASRRDVESVEAAMEALTDHLKTVGDAATSASNKVDEHQAQALRAIQSYEDSMRNTFDAAPESVPWEQR